MPLTPPNPENNQQTMTIYIYNKYIHISHKSHKINVCVDWPEFAHLKMNKHWMRKWPCYTYYTLTGPTKVPFCKSQLVGKWSSPTNGNPFPTASFLRRPRSWFSCAQWPYQKQRKHLKASQILSFLVVGPSSGFRPISKKGPAFYMWLGTASPAKTFSVM